MDDRELLEKAAKAAGLVNASYFAGTDKYKEGVWFDDEHGRSCFNPLTDDGDALRLAVKLHLELDASTDPICAGDGVIGVREPCGTDRYAATRLAIVRAAAAIGESK
jgi:hypothetical protein